MKEKRSDNEDDTVTLLANQSCCRRDEVSNQSYQQDTRIDNLGGGHSLSCYRCCCYCGSCNAVEDDTAGQISRCWSSLPGRMGKEESRKERTTLILA